MSRALRYVAPRLLRSEGGADLPGPAGWVTAFTSAARPWPGERMGASHLHRCSFRGEWLGQQWRGLITWRVESQPLGIALPQAVRVVEGEAASLHIAHEAALAAALRPLGQEDAGEFDLGPAFMALPVMAGQPRIWGCAALVAPVSPSIGREAASHVCFIRERLAAGGPSFLCTLERDEDGANGPLVAHWVENTLPEAAESGCEAVLGQAAVWPEGRL